MGVFLSGFESPLRQPIEMIRDSVLGPSLFFVSSKELARPLRACAHVVTVPVHPASRPLVRGVIIFAKADEIIPFIESHPGLRKQKRRVGTPWN